MTAESLFSIAGYLVLPGWLILIFAPRWKHGAALISGVIIPVLLAFLYGWLVAANFSGTDGGYETLAGVRALFTNDYLLLAGWVHYLAFDLFVGSWIVRDAARLSISHFVVVPCLLLTFFFRTGRTAVVFVSPCRLESNVDTGRCLDGSFAHCIGVIGS